MVRFGQDNGGKCKVNWEIVCLLLEFGGLGVLKINKFTRALRLRWPWYKWKEPTKMWVGMGKPCDEEDHNFFYASTTITIGNPCWLLCNTKRGGNSFSVTVQGHLFGTLLGFLGGCQRTLPRSSMKLP